MIIVSLVVLVVRVAARRVVLVVWRVKGERGLSNVVGCLAATIRSLISALRCVYGELLSEVVDVVIGFFFNEV